MAKKSSLVDKALEVSRKNRVPKKPVKTKGKKTVPAVLDWGTGIPEDKLAYLNDDEMALVQAKRTFKGKRSVDGVPAFPDPGDTAAGAKSSGPDRGPTGGPSRTSPSSGAGAGSGGLGGGGKGGPGGSPGGSPSAGGSNAGSSGGQSSPSGGAGGQKATPSGGPGGGSLSAPARTAPSSAPSSPAGFGPRQSSMPGNPVSTAPSTQSWQGAVDRIAQGSSVVGNPTGVKQFTDRVPQAAPKAVNYSQTPTVSPNMSGPGNYSSLSSITSGANSPFADPGVTSYDAEKERDRAIASARTAAQSGILGPSVPAGTAIQRDPYFGSEQVANRFSGSLPSIGVNTTAYSAPIGPTQSQQLAADAMKNIFSGSPEVQTTPQRIGRGPMVNVGRYGTATQTPGDYSAYRQAQAERDFANSIGENVYGGPPASAPSGMGPSTQPASVAAPTAYGPSVASVDDPYSQRYSKVASYLGTVPPTQKPAYQPSDMMGTTRSIGSLSGPNQGLGYSPAKPNIQPASAPAPSYSGNPFNTGYPNPQTEDIRRAVEIAQEPAAPKKQGPIDVPGYPAPQADISPSQGDYSPSQAPAYNVSPSQQSGWTSAQRDAYLGGLGNSKTGQVPVSQNGGQPQGSPVVPAAPMTTLAPMPDWVDYSYLYNDYPQLALGATPNIGAFNQYNATFKRGGRVGDSIEAALRLALQGIVSRNKTS